MTEVSNWELYLTVLLANNSAIKLHRPKDAKNLKEIQLKKSVRTHFILPVVSKELQLVESRHHNKLFIMLNTQDFMKLLPFVETNARHAL